MHNAELRTYHDFVKAVAPSNVKILWGELNQPKADAQTIEIVVDDGMLVAC